MAGTRVLRRLGESRGRLPLCLREFKLHATKGQRCPEKVG